MQLAKQAKIGIRKISWSTLSVSIKHYNQSENHKRFDADELYQLERNERTGPLKCGTNNNCEK